MKFKLKECEILCDKNDKTYITNFDMDDVVNKFISFKHKFHMPDELSFTKEDVIDWLKNIRDNDNIWSLDDYVLTLKSENIKHQRKYLTGHTTNFGTFRLHVMISKDNSIDTIGMTITSKTERVNHVSGIFTISYDKDSEDYKDYHKIFFVRY